MKKRQIIVAALSLALAAANSVPALAAGWVRTPQGYKYQHGDGSDYRNDWLRENNQWYYFGDDGIMRTGWIQRDNTWYFASDTGQAAGHHHLQGVHGFPIFLLHIQIVGVSVPQKGDPPFPGPPGRRRKQLAVGKQLLRVLDRPHHGPALDPLRHFHQVLPAQISGLRLLDQQIAPLRLLQGFFRSYSALR